eukprot:COSAG04_NODE_51_length_31064_cov_38.384789_12_plen_58_part_00
MQRASQRDRNSDGSEKKDGQQGKSDSKGEFGERESEAYVDWGQVGGGCAVIEDLHTP